jgi:hypothetical protein
VKDTANSQEYFSVIQPGKGRIKKYKYSSLKLLLKKQIPKVSNI